MIKSHFHLHRLKERKKETNSQKHNTQTDCERTSPMRAKFDSWLEVNGAGTISMSNVGKKKKM